MFSTIHLKKIIPSCLVLLFLLSCLPQPSKAGGRALSSLEQQQPLVLKYHNGPVLEGNITVNLIWYGNFSPAQRAILTDFLNSLNSDKKNLLPSVSAWWQTIASYRGGSRSITLGTTAFNTKYTLGKSLNSTHLKALSKPRNLRENGISIVFTSEDVTLDGFCMDSCGTHGWNKVGENRFVYLWVGNPTSQCPGYCAWPFHKPLVGPQNPPLKAPNGDVGVDGMVINLATVLAGAVTNPFDSGYFQGPPEMPLEAVSACTGIYGKGAFPGYPGQLLMDKKTGASYNANGHFGRKYLLPAMWDPKTLACKTLV